MYIKNITVRSNQVYSHRTKQILYSTSLQQTHGDEAMLIYASHSTLLNTTGGMIPITMKIVTMMTTAILAFRNAPLCC